jgi:2',3'-cyclic-nucleotide 2'-phosphodiesterase (5'-nucleotidase family)
MTNMLKITILHTNDIHGRIPQLTRIASRVREIRQEVTGKGGYCLYVDAGDSEDTTLLESSLTKGSAMNAILRGAGCDYAALGNAVPIRYGPGQVAELAKYFGRPLLCANMYDENHTLVEGLEPFIIHDFDSFKFGIIGVTDPVKTYSVFGLHVKKPEDVLPGLIEEVRSLGARTILLLSHLGLRQDQRVLENIAGIDVLIGGHSHSLLDPPLEINGTILAQAGEYGKVLGRLDLEIDPVTGKIVHYRSTFIVIDETIPPDPTTESVVSSEQDRVKQLMARIIGTLTDPLDLAEDRECAAGNLLADALLDRVEGAEIAFVLAGLWETGLEAGPLTQGALYAANRSPANPAKVELTGAQIEQFFRAALLPENMTKAPQALRGRKMGMPHVAGMTVCYDPSTPTALEIHVNGQLLKSEQKYIVATTDFELSDLAGYLVIPDEHVNYEVPTIMPEVLEAYITKYSPISKPQAGRIKLKGNESGEIE